MSDNAVYQMFCSLLREFWLQDLQYSKTDGILAQSVEHLTFNQVVRGSNPRCLIEKGTELV